jgi:hypothetical protein
MAHSVSSDACQTTSGQDVTVNVEELEVGVGEGTERISFPEIKAESEVSCESVFIITNFKTTVCTHVCCLSNISVCMTISHHLKVVNLVPTCLCWLRFCGTFVVKDSFHIVLYPSKIHEISF